MSSGWLHLFLLIHKSMLTSWFGSAGVFLPSLLPVVRWELREGTKLTCCELPQRPIQQHSCNRVRTTGGARPAMVRLKDLCVPLSHHASVSTAARRRSSSCGMSCGGTFPNETGRRGKATCRGHSHLPTFFSNLYGGVLQ